MVRGDPVDMVIARIQWTGDNTDEVLDLLRAHVVGAVATGEARPGVLPLSINGEDIGVPRGYWIEVVDGGVPGVVVTEEPSDG